MEAFEMKAGKTDTIKQGKVPSSHNCSPVAGLPKTREEKEKRREVLSKSIFPSLTQSQRNDIYQQSFKQTSGGNFSFRMVNKDLMMSLRGAANSQSLHQHSFRNLFTENNPWDQDLPIMRRTILVNEEQKS